MGGEKMSLLGNGLSSMGSPPHGRGKVSSSSGLPMKWGITPAWAGKSDHGLFVRTLAGDHPRMGGEKPSVL